MRLTTRWTALIAAIAQAGAAQAADPLLRGAFSGPPVVQSVDQAIEQDAAAYASRHGVALNEAVRRLRAQEASVAATNALGARFGERLAGVSIEHSPIYRIVVLLTGAEPVADEQIVAAGLSIPLHFRTGARASERAVVLALRVHQATLRADLPGARGLGFDPRSGALVIIFDQAEVARRGGAGEVERRASLLTGVPVRVRVADGGDVNMVVGGGARIEGQSVASGQWERCTSGFVVSDGVRYGLATAAHCPDAITYHDPDGGTVALEMAGSWGARVQDIQVNLSPVPLRPLFYADGSNRSLRTVTSWRNRESTRAGDMVCHWGESSGYSCAEVELTHFAPPGALCGGPCEPSWVTVATSSCKGGDSGGPVFVGTIAFGIVKGGNRDRDGRCNFYYYMSTDYLPGSWRLLYANGSASIGLPKGRVVG